MLLGLLWHLQHLAQAPSGWKLAWETLQSKTAANPAVGCCLAWAALCWFKSKSPQNSCALLRNLTPAWMLPMTHSCTHTSCYLNHSLNIRRPCTTPEGLETPWPSARELPSVSLSLDAAVSPSLLLACLHILGAPFHLVRIWRLSTPFALESSWAEQKAWLNLSPPGAKGLEVATHS